VHSQTKSLPSRLISSSC